MHQGTRSFIFSYFCLTNSSFCLWYSRLNFLVPSSGSSFFFQGLSSSGCLRIMPRMVLMYSFTSSSIASATAAEGPMTPSASPSAPAARKARSAAGSDAEVSQAADVSLAPGTAWEAEAGAVRPAGKGLVGPMKPRGWHSRSPEAGTLTPSQCRKQSQSA